MTKKRVIGIISILLVLSILTLIIGGAVAGVLYLTFGKKTINYKDFSIEVPAMYFDLNKDRQASHFFKMHIVSIYNDSFEDLKKQGYDNIITEDDYWKYYFIDNYEYELNGRRISSTNYEKTEIGGYPVWEFDIFGGGYRPHIIAYIYKGPDSFWVLFFDSEDDAFDDFRDDIPEIIASFKLK